jgi:hypothetical protein
LKNWSIGQSMIRGNEAIVVVMSNAWCLGKVCYNNSDPGRGLPKKAKTFENAFYKTTPVLPALGVVRVKDKWYVALA